MIDKVRSFQQGDEESFEEILTHFHDLLTTLSYKLPIKNMTNEDVYQIGSIGLFKAAKYFNHEKMDKFEPYAILCMRRNIFTAITSSKSKKNTTLDLISRNDLDLCYSSRTNPEKILICKELKERVAEDIETVLSKKEKQIFRLSLEHDSILDVVEESNMTYEQLGNGLQRAKAKLRRSAKRYLAV